jgi:hypothetical protein
MRLEILTRLTHDGNVVIYSDIGHWCVCFSTTGLIVCYSLFPVTVLSTGFGFQMFETPQTLLCK